MYRFHRAAMFVLAALLSAQATFAQPEPIKPGWNLFSKEQDVALGKEASAEIEKEVQVVNDRQLSAYVRGIGERLATVSQDPDFPFTFKVVADPSINAFALPGGPTYVNSGLIAAADNEAQLAGVMAHEIGHVVLRHSTNQASKRSLFQLPAVLASGALGGDGGMLGSLANIGLGFGLNSAMMKYSRNAEHDADIIGARMMAAAGYDPVEMANFFMKLEEAGAGRGPQFLSDHPNPGNRVQYVTEEIASYRNGNYAKTSRSFPTMRARAGGIQPTATTTPEITAANNASAAGGAAAGEPVASGPGYEFLIPEQWTAVLGNDDVTSTVLPEDGATRTRRGQTVIRRGILAGYFASEGNLRQATDRFIANLQQSNSRLVPDAAQRKNFHAGDSPAESNFLVGPSATVRGARENIWLVTTQRPQGLFYMAMISPVDEYGGLYPSFQRSLSSLRFPSQTAATTTTPAPPVAPQPPVEAAGVFRGTGYTVPYPPDWTVVRNAQTGGARITPANGVLRGQNGSEAITRGLLVGSYDTTEQLSPATTSLLNGFTGSNPSLTVMNGQRKAVTVDGQPGESIFLEGPSSLEGQREYVWIITTRTQDGLFYLVMISPQGEYRSLYPTFETTANNVTID